MDIEPMPEAEFRMALAILTRGDLGKASDQHVANLMVVAACVHALGFNEAARRGWCGMSDAGQPVVTYPAWPEGVELPKCILTDQRNSSHA